MASQDIIKVIGKNIERMCYENDISVETLAKKLNITEKILKEIIEGKLTNIRISLVFSLAKIFNCSDDEFYLTNFYKKDVNNYKDFNLLSWVEQSKVIHTLAKSSDTKLVDKMELSKRLEKDSMGYLFKVTVDDVKWLLKED